MASIIRLSYTRLYFLESTSRTRPRAPATAAPTTKAEIWVGMSSKARVISLIALCGPKKARLDLQTAPWWRTWCPHWRQTSCSFDRWSKLQNSFRRLEGDLRSKVALFEASTSLWVEFEIRSCSCRSILSRRFVTRRRCRKTSSQVVRRRV